MERSQSPLHGRSAAVLVISLLLAVLGFGAVRASLPPMRATGS